MWPGEIIGEGAASVAVEGPGLKWSCKKLRLGTIRRAYERLLVNVQPSCSKELQHFEDTSTIGWPPRIVATSVEWSQLEPRRQTVCAAEGRGGKGTQAFWRSLADGEWSPVYGWFEFSFALI